MNPNAPIPSFRGPFKLDVVPPVKHHHLHFMEGRYYDYDERTMFSTPLPRCTSIESAAAIWRGRLRAEVMDI